MIGNSLFDIGYSVFRIPPILSGPKGRPKPAQANGLGGAAFYEPFRPNGAAQPQRRNPPSANSNQMKKPGIKRAELEDELEPD